MKLLWFLTYSNKVVKIITHSVVILFTIIQLPSIAATPQWSVNPNDFTESMTVIAVLDINGDFSNDGSDLVGAFVNDEIRGVANPSITVTSTGQLVVFLVIYSNSPSGEMVHFKIYDASQDDILDAVNEFNFQSDSQLGENTTPIRITNIPFSVLLSNTFIEENSEIGIEVGTISTNEEGIGNTFTYSLVPGESNDDNELFSIDVDKLITSAIFDYENASSYNIRIGSDNGRGGILENTFTISIIDVAESENMLPSGNFISPNGDGINDFWRIANVEIYSGYKLIIYSPEGEVLFTTNEYKNDWDGFYRGSPLPTGVYFYVFISPDGSNDFKGTISLIRE